ncbi:hypothetical protein Cflav_PD6396 [Pedosphaera parvula Ellin514]|uniref:Uncharacterized protein n=1 Tax=Pedosphaera parvula (strain Ellin514) TaxID=320771 RepID=B9XDH5_PEDPL|nr:hypothetical protein Cflav_PD6396 [Pedosphaera parvula Ellin514]
MESQIASALGTMNWIGSQGRSGKRRSAFPTFQLIAGAGIASLVAYASWA